MGLLSNCQNLQKVGHDIVIFNGNVLGYAWHTWCKKGTNRKRMSCSSPICHMQIFKSFDFRTMGLWIWITFILIRTVYKGTLLKLWSKLLEIFLLFSLYFSSLNLKYLKFTKMDLTRLRWNSSYIQKVVVLSTYQLRHKKPTRNLGFLLLLFCWMRLLDDFRSKLFIYNNITVLLWTQWFHSLWSLPVISIHNELISLKDPPPPPYHSMFCKCVILYL